MQTTTVRTPSLPALPNIPNLWRAIVRMLNSGERLNETAAPRRQTGACSRRVLKRSYLSPGTARGFSFLSRIHGNCRTDLPRRVEDKRNRSLPGNVHPELVPLGRYGPPRDFRGGVGCGRGERWNGAIPICSGTCSPRL